MPLPEDVDLDKLISFLLDCEKKAITGWLDGVPKDETAFMNRLTGQLAKLKRGCDVGLKPRVVVYPRVYELHRRAKDSSDALGSDLAITVSILPAHYVKTALFQVKAGKGFSAQLERHQLEAATATKEVADRSFVLYVDEGRGSIRIAKAVDLLVGWPKSQATKTFSSSSWMALSAWATGWLSCDIGPVSDNPYAATSLENTLRKYEAEPAARLATLVEPAGPLAWLIFAFQVEGVDVAGKPLDHFFEQRLT
jgi:hypothetical protein